MIWFTIALLFATYIAGELLRPKPRLENKRPAGLGDFRFPTAELGRPVPLVWGTCLVEGPNVVWYGDIRQKAIKQGVKTGLFSSKRVKVGYRYSVGIQFGICRSLGLDVTLKRILVAEKEVFAGTQATEGAISINKPKLFGGDDLGTGGVVGTVRWYTGGPAQTPSAYLAPFQGNPLGIDQPRYPGTCQAVLERVYVGNSTQIDPWAFEVERIPNGLGLAGGGRVNTSDANPLNVAYELFTMAEADGGPGFDPSEIDVAGWTTAANTLTTEGNGFSMVLDSKVEWYDVVEEIERQINGIISLDHVTGKWRVKLIRADYDINTVPEITAANLIETKDYGQASWFDTTNQVRVEFQNRENKYQDDQAVAQDSGNYQAQGFGGVLTGRTVPTSVRYPGVKNRTLANELAWRDLRTVSRPFGKGTVVVDRTLYETKIGDVLAWTNAQLGLTKFPVRVQRIDHGELRDGRITLDVVEDVFYYLTGSFGDPPETEWEEPLQEEPEPFPADEQLAMEAPRAFVFRDPEFDGEKPKLWCSGRAQNAEIAFEIMYRHAAGAPSGSFISGGKVYGFMLIGTLKNTLANSGSIPAASILVEAGPDTQADLEAAFEDSVVPSDLGTNLKNLILIIDPSTGWSEFMAPTSAATSGADVDLQNVYRGLLDTGRPGWEGHHEAGSPVYLIFVGGGLAEGTIPETDNVHVKLLPETRAAQLDIGDAVQIALTMNRRNRRPYPPGNVTVNGTAFPSSASLDANSSLDEARALRVVWVRRDFRTAEGRDEVQALTTDAASLFADFPTVNNHRTRIEVFVDPEDGVPPPVLFTEDNLAGTTKDILRIKILRFTDGAVPAKMYLTLYGKHDQGGTSDLLSSYPTSTVFTTSSADLAGLFNFGARAAAVTSNNLPVPAGVYPCTLSTAFTTGPQTVEYSTVGLGIWFVAIAGGATSGNVDTFGIPLDLIVRHNGTDSGAIKQFNIFALPGPSVRFGYFICYV